MKAYAIALIALLAAFCATLHQDERSGAQVADSERYPRPGSNQRNLGKVVKVVYRRSTLPFDGFIWVFAVV